MTTELETIFVYGTLRNKASLEPFHVLEKYASFEGEATVRGCLYDLGTYPGMVLSDDSTKVVFGELYHIPHKNWDEIIAMLDDYEGCGSNDEKPHEYYRSIVIAKTSDGLERQVWAYLFNRSVDGLPIITTGGLFEKTLS